MITCPKCNGSGAIRGHMCPVCEGKGKVFPIGLFIIILFGFMLFSFGQIYERTMIQTFPQIMQIDR